MILLYAWPLLVIAGALLHQMGRRRHDPWLRQLGRLGVYAGLCAAGWWSYALGAGVGLLTLLMVLTWGSWWSGSATCCSAIRATRGHRTRRSDHAASRGAGETVSTVREALVRRRRALGRRRAPQPPPVRGPGRGELP
jgi:hypothetical protein